ncbi:hypothetical protein [uncultured Christiangramia sp.]|uniref:hypothetical protein n=1 Tax=uncultured Christiangramia sp. TaxID=503836 RepID=UPI0026329B77|nr:hypothetical protein [uncultured Christiangramia sp.]
MNKTAEDLKNGYYNSDYILDSEDLVNVFEKVFDIFVDANYQNDSTLFCSIHNSFNRGHNCIGCNLDSNNRRIENFLIQFKYFSDINLTFTSFILLLYLQVECITEYFKIIEIQERYRTKHFQVFTLIKRWANFLKHPKAFMLVHHPNWSFENRIFADAYVKKLYKNTNPTIDSSFINRYYNSDKNNKDLYRKLEKKEDLLVMFPDPIEIIKDFTNAQIKFVELISENSIARELLEDQTTIEKHFNQDLE